MKVLICGDVHWSTTSSIVKKRGRFYSVRLQHLIESINYVEYVAESHKCDLVVYLGDFFDKTTLTSEEVTALSSVKWSKNIPHKFIVGNHESPNEDLRFSSTNVLYPLTQCTSDIVNNVLCQTYWNDCNIIYVPYMTDKYRPTIADLVSKERGLIDAEDRNLPIYIFSHNDIKGINYGKHTTQTGFDIKDISDNCTRFINGHIHNGSFIDKDKKILNVGIICGQDFKEDATIYEHSFVILDTKTNELKQIVNPHALNFYKVEVNDENDIDKLKSLSKQIPNGVVCITANENLVTTCNEFCQTCSSIVEWRVITKYEELDEDSEKTETVNFNNMNATDKLIEFIKLNKELADLEIVKQELDIIIGGGK